MSRSSKVVPISDNSARRGGATLVPILDTIRTSSRRHLTESVQALFNNADDALFEMADRSRNDADQHLYFDSMREIRLHRRQIAEAYLTLVHQGFDAPPEAEPPAEEEDQDFETTVGNFTLVKNDDLEVSVAVAGIVSKVTSRYSLQIMQLTKRVDSLIDDRDVTEQTNPLGPQLLTDAFVNACQDIQVDIRIRIILLKLFERYVMEPLGPCYDEANRVLAEAGVLPDLRHVIKKSPTARTDYPIADDAEALREATETGFAMLQALLGKAGGTGVPGTGVPGTGVPGTGVQGTGAPGAGPGGAADGTQTAGGAGPVVSRPQLMDALSGLQTDDIATPIDVSLPPTSLDLRGLVTSRTPDGHLGQADEDTVNLVGMLFDYILNDRNLAIPMKALIARLQIPMLKVSILDKTFFAKTSHPARQLLNELSSAGIGWSGASELKRDSLYNKIESVVLRVLNNFEEDLGLFDSLVAELRSFVGQDHRRSEIVEQRVRESETGKAKTVNAKQTVEQLVNQKASGLRLPSEVGRFISEVWSRFLVYVCVKHGTESEPWTQGLETFDDLLWSIQPLDNLGDVGIRQDRVPALMERLAAGMRMISLPDVDVEKTLESVRAALDEISSHDRMFLDDDDADLVEPDLPVMEEIVLTAPGDVLQGESNFEPSAKASEKLGELHEGVWVEMNQESGDRVRCKLAAIVDPGDKYVFVNRRGMKVAERTRSGLAVAFEADDLTVLDESQVFDRALEAVIGNLRSLHRS